MKELSGRALASISEGRSLSCQLSRFGDNYGMLDCVFQFADVARPPVARRAQFRHVIIDARDLPAMLFVRSLNEMLDQQGQVLDTLSERRKMN